MALKNTVSIFTNLGTQAEFKDAYIRVENVVVSKERCHFLVHTYKDKDGIVVGQKRHVFDYAIEGSNPIRQAYEHLKTLPEFSGAVDC